MSTNASREPGVNPGPYEHLRSAPADGCDLVMEGGVTSGVVYPAAVLKLAGRYHFRAVGGASAGAIAAAATAAAEYGRAADGFAKFAKMQDELKKGSEFFARVFRPSEDAHLLFDAIRATKGVVDKWNEQGADKTASGLVHDLLESAKGTSRVRKVVDPERDDALRAIQWLVERASRPRLDEHALWQALAGSVAIAGSLVMIALVCGVGATVVGALLALIVCGVPAFFVLQRALSLYRGAQALGDDIAELQEGLDRINSQAGFFGFCSGHDRATPPADGPLTDWMHAQFQELANKGPADPPLTCKELEERQITFQLVTTDLSRGQPLILPREEGGDELYFKPHELERLFPESVMSALLDYSAARGKTRPPPEGFHYFPTGKEIPVIVATRLSLSFPVLLCAVPLYTFDGDTPCQHWFSDGGIANNFPIHFFDSWIPSRPTFGITLADSPLEGTSIKPLKRPSEHLRDVVMLRPKDADRPSASQTRYDIQGLPSFVNALLSTTRSYRDKLQASLPSYLERVVTVFLQPNEGGLNLDMESDVVARMMAKGEDAAGLILNQFNYDEHRWVRSLVLASRLEAELNRVRSGPGGKVRPVADLRSDYDLVLKKMADSLTSPKGPFYRAKGCPDWQQQARARMGALFDLMETWQALEDQWRTRPLTPPEDRDDKDAYAFFKRGKPVPEALLRITPEL